MSDDRLSNDAPKRDNRTREEMIADFERAIAMANEQFPDEPPGKDEKWYLPLVELWVGTRVRDPLHEQ